MRRLLFISAPFGRFFAELAKELETSDCEVYRLCFEGGDWLETPVKNRVVFRGPMDKLADFSRDLILSKKIDGVISFNDVLERNRTVLNAAAQCGAKRYVIENGYLRPHWITFEVDGVNAFSNMPRDAGHYRAYAQKSFSDSAVDAPKPFPSFLYHHIRSTVSHFSGAIALSPIFGFNHRYYGDSISQQMIGYVKEYLLRYTYSEDQEAQRVQAAYEEGNRKIFTVLMQKPGDGQLTVHSRFGGNKAFIEEVVSSFANFAPKNAFLIIKQHPLDYGVEGCPRFARELIKKFGLQDRAIYLRKTSIDICMDYSAGIVTVNSTGGLQALQKGLAVKCLGAAVYGFEGLTYQGSLDDFWASGRAADPDVLVGYVRYLQDHSQLNGGFHSKQARELVLPAIRDRLLRDAPGKTPDRRQAPEGLNILGIAAE